MASHNEGSRGPHIYCPSVADAALRLARGLPVLGELLSQERQPGDP